MEYRRVYWLCFLGIGLLFAVQATLDFAAMGAASLTTVVSAIAALVIVATAVFALRDPDRAGGPDGPGLLFFVAVAALLLMIAGTVLRLVG